MNIQTSIRILLTLTFLALLSACGASSSSQDTLDLGSNGTPTTKPLAVCNKAMSANLSYKVAAQVATGGYDPNWANLYLTNLPASFGAGTTNIQFHKGQANGDAALAYNTTAVPFGIFNRNTNQYFTNSSGAALTFSSLVWNDVKDLIPGATPATFSSQVIFVLSLQDPSSLYQVLTVGSYNITGGAHVESAASLLPTFHASPADYATKANGLSRETVLRNLHPLRNQVGNYATLASQLCI